MTDLSKDVANVQAILDAAISGGIVSNLQSAATLANSWNNVIQALNHYIELKKVRTDEPNNNNE